MIGAKVCTRFLSNHAVCIFLLFGPATCNRLALQLKQVIGCWMMGESKFGFTIKFDGNLCSKHLLLITSITEYMID